MKFRCYGLSSRDMDILKICMDASCLEVFFADWEFSTLFGIEREELRQVISLYPNFDLDNPVHKAAIRGSLGHLLGYPHGEDSKLEILLGSDILEIKRVLDKLIKQ